MVFRVEEVIRSRDFPIPNDFLEYIDIERLTYFTQPLIQLLSAAMSLMEE